MNAKFEEAVKGLYPKVYETRIQDWLKERYGKKDAEEIWEKSLT